MLILVAPELTLVFPSADIPGCFDVLPVDLERARAHHVRRHLVGETGRRVERIRQVVRRLDCVRVKMELSLPVVEAPGDHPRAPMTERARLQVVDLHLRDPAVGDRLRPAPHEPRIVAQVHQVRAAADVVRGWLLLGAHLLLGVSNQDDVHPLGAHGSR